MSPILRRFRADPFRTAAMLLTAMLLVACIAWLLGLLSQTPANDRLALDDPAVQRGQAIAQAMCSRCHALGAADASPNPASPPFRDMLDRLPEEGIEDTLLEGILLGHSPMPKIEFTNEQASDLIAFMSAVARKERP